MNNVVFVFVKVFYFFGFFDKFDEFGFEQEFLRENGKFFLSDVFFKNVFFWYVDFYVLVEDVLSVFNGLYFVVFFKNSFNCFVLENGFYVKLLLFFGLLNF